MLVLESCSQVATEGHLNCHAPINKHLPAILMSRLSSCVAKSLFHRFLGKQTSTHTVVPAVVTEGSNRS